MEPTFFHLDIVSAEKLFFSASVEKFLVPGSEGELEIHKGHAPLLTTIKPGMIRIVKSHSCEEIIYISGGVVEVQPTISTVLADTVFRGEELDEERIVEAKLHAEESLKNGKDGPDHAHAAREIAKLRAQWRVIKQVKILR